MKKLNIGCGHDIRKGFINADIDDSIKGVDKKIDINKLPLPFKDDEFDYILMNSLLEYAHDTFRSLGEIHRIARPGAIVDLRVPYCNTPLSAFHKGFYTDLFKFTGKAKGKETYLDQEFKVIKISLIPTFWGRCIPDIPFPRYLGLRHFISSFLFNIVRQIEFTVKVIKKP